MKIQDRNLIEKAQKGDTLAFEELVRIYDRKVLSLALKYLNNEEDAKDAYQEVFIRVFRNIKKFKFESEFSTWLFRITTNVCFTFKTKNKKTSTVDIMYNTDEEEMNPMDTLSGHSPTPDEKLSQFETSMKISDAINKLSAKQKLVFIMKHFEGYKIREIAEITEIKEGTIKKYLFEAVNRLRCQLEFTLNR